MYILVGAVWLGNECFVDAADFEVFDKIFWVAFFMRWSQSIAHKVVIVCQCVGDHAGSGATGTEYDDVVYYAIPNDR